MKIEIEMRWAECDKEFHYTLYVNDIFICSVCSFDIVKLHLKNNFSKFKET